MVRHRALFHPDSSGAGPGPQPVPRPVIQPLRPNGPTGAPGAPGTSGSGPVAAGSGAIASAAAQEASKIRQLDQRLAGGGPKHEDNWTRSPNVTGTGAIHVKSFHCKLTGESLEFLDKQINEWLDAHPQYEVKFASATVGEWMGKLKEPNLILQLWV